MLDLECPSRSLTIFTGTPADKAIPTPVSRVVRTRAAAVAWAFLGVCFVIAMFGQLLDLPMWVQDISPFRDIG